MKVRILAFIVLISSVFSIFCETPEPYKKEEFPGFMHDLRRAEIITLGAMPFITFNVTLGYSFGNYAFHNFDSSYFVNPFSSESDNKFSTDEQIGIILTSVGISAGIGLTDFIVHSVKRSNQYRKNKRNKNKEIIINPVTVDPNATPIPPAEEHFSTEPSEETSPAEAEDVIEVIND